MDGNKIDDVYFSGENRKKVFIIKLLKTNEDDDKDLTSKMLFVWRIKNAPLENIWLMVMMDFNYTIDFHLTLQTLARFMAQFNIYITIPLFLISSSLSNHSWVYLFADTCSSV